MASTVAVQWAYEIAGEIASDAVKAMALAMSLTKSFDTSILEQVIALKAGELRHCLLRAIRPVQGPVRFPQKNKNCSADLLGGASLPKEYHSLVWQCYTGWRIA